jgi:hypothetical protein
MKGNKNLGYAPTKLLEFAANNNYIPKPHSKDDSSISLEAKPTSMLYSQDDITLGSKDKTLNSAKQEYLNLDSKTKSECHLKWFFSLDEEGKKYHSKSWKEGEGVSPNSAEMTEVLKEVYSGLSDDQRQDFIKRFKEYDYCGIGLDRASMTVALSGFATEFDKENSGSDLQNQLNIGSEKISKNNPISFQAYRGLLTTAVFLGIVSKEVAAQCNGDPNIVCPPTFSPTSFPSFFPTVDPTLMPTLMPTLSPSSLIDAINETLSPSRAPSPSPTPSPSLFLSQAPSFSPSFNTTEVFSSRSEDNNLWDEDKPWVYFLAGGVAITLCCGAVYLCCSNGKKDKVAVSGADSEYTYEQKQINAGVRAEKLAKGNSTNYSLV